jgi:hypothetical protein
MITTRSLLGAATVQQADESIPSRFQVPQVAGYVSEEGVDANASQEVVAAADKDDKADKADKAELLKRVYEDSVRELQDFANLLSRVSGRTVSLTEIVGLLNSDPKYDAAVLRTFFDGGDIRAH